MASFLARRKSARAWRGELSSRSMMAQRASATAWSDTVWLFSRDLLSCRMVDLEGSEVDGRCSRRLTRLRDKPPSQHVVLPAGSGTVWVFWHWVRCLCPKAGSESPGGAAGSQVTGS